MSDKEQRTEQATPRRRDKARGEGKVARSQDLTSASNFIFAFIALVFTGVASATLMARNAVNVLSRLDSSTMGQLASLALEVTIRVVAPASVAAMVGGLVAGFGQVGWKPTFKPLKPDLKRFNPLPKLQQMFFSTNSLVEVLKALAKIAIVGSIVGGVIYRQIVGSRLRRRGIGQVLEHIGDVPSTSVGVLPSPCSSLPSRCFWQRHRFEQSIKMTRHEVREEYKEIEGDPHMKGRRRQRMREFAGRRRRGRGRGCGRRRQSHPCRCRPPVQTAGRHRANGRRQGRGQRGSRGFGRRPVTTTSPSTTTLPGPSIGPAGSRGPAHSARPLSSRRGCVGCCLASTSKTRP